MPIYEYKCKKCGSHFEKRQSVSEDPLTVCEHCEGELEKQWSLSGFAFKGEGWYVTDYQKKNGAKSESSGETSEKAATTTSAEGSASKTSSEGSSKSE